MKITLRILVLCATCTVLLATGCEPNTPFCDDSYLQAAELIYPEDQAIIDYPILGWQYPDPTCHPKNYLVSLYTMEEVPQLRAKSTGDISVWELGVPLLPGMMYAWSVISFNEPGSMGILSPKSYFYTGPMCGPEDLDAPIPFYPPPGYTFKYLAPTFKWEYPSPCLPDSYQVELAADLEFNGIWLSVETPHPSTFYKIPILLQDCMDYFWHVAARIDGTLSSYSDAMYFHTDRVNECPSGSSGTLRGKLWYDQCPIHPDPDIIPFPLPEGCVADSYGADGDGILQAGEPALLNVVVQLAPGECPQEGTLTAITDMDGNYRFTGLEPGIYCLHVDATQFPDGGGTGHWTLVAGDAPLHSYRTVFLSSGEVKSGMDFAWYQYTAKATEISPDIFTPDFNVYCRMGDGSIFDVLDVAVKSTPYLIDGRNQDGTWLRIMLTSSKGCWVPANTGVLSRDIITLRVLYSIPTPTPMVVDCSIYRDKTSCEAQPTCTWKRSEAVGLDYCTSK